MRLKTKIVLAASVVLVVLVAVVSVGLIRVMSSSRPEVSRETLLIDSPSILPGLDRATWSAELSGVERPEVGLVSSWQSSDLGARVALEIERFDNALVAEWRFRTHYTQRIYEDDFGSTLVQSVSPPDLAADSVRIFCGNIGVSTTPALEDCQIWVVRVRYGQYVINFEIYNMRVSRNEFIRISEALDEHIESELGS